MSTPTPTGAEQPADPARSSRPERVRLVVLFGGRSAEHDISCVTARHVLDAADPERYELVPVGITRDGAWVTPEVEAGSTPVAIGASTEPGEVVAADAATTTVVLPLLHGPMGEDGTVQGLLELADAAYVGTGVLGSALAMDKVAAKTVAAAHGLAQGRWIGLHESQVDATALAEAVETLGLPVFVKPANMGSSIGVGCAADATELEEAVAEALTYDEWVVLEETIAGREIECAVLGHWADPQASLPGEIVPGAEFYDYADKYHDGAAELHIPAPLDDETTDRVRQLACTAFRALRCEGLARVDFFLEEPGRGLLLNEVNTIPGFTPISMYPKMWEASGLAYGDLIDELVRLALDRHATRRRRTDVGSA